MAKLWCAGATLIAGVCYGAQSSDAAAMLAATRQALGGEAALSAIASFSGRGNVTSTMPGIPSASSTLEITGELPDKFIEVRRRSVSRGPLGSFDITTYEGVSGSEPIHSVVAPDAPMPVFLPGPPPKTPAEAAAAKERQANGFKRRFARLSAALLGGSVPGYPVQFAPGTPTAAADVLDASGPDGGRFSLHLDRATHLPIRIIWMDRPVVTMSRTSIVTARPGKPPPNVAATSLPSGDPTAGMPDVTWQLAIGDYRAENGVNWPRRFTTTVDGKPYEDARIDRYRLNPRIDPRTFTPPK